MPTVRKYEGDQVRTQIVDKPLAKSNDYGAFDNTKGIISTVENITDFAFDIRKRTIVTEAEEASVNFEREKNEVLFNPENGYFNTQGRNAYEGSKEVSETIENIKKKYSEGLRSPEARQVFDKVATAHVDRANADIMRHASKGLKTWEISTLNSQVENSIENGSLYWNDPDRLKVQNASGRMAIIDAAKIEGVGSETINERLQTFDSSFYSGAITSAVQSSAAEGESLYESYGDFLEGPEKLKINKEIQTKKRIEKTQADANYAVIKGSQLVRDYDTRQEIIDQVNKENDAERRDKLMTEAIQQFNQRETAKKEISNTAYESMIDQINNGVSVTQLQSLNPEAWEVMDSKQRNNLLSGKHQLTDQVEFNRLMTLPKKELAEVNPVDYSTVFKPADLTKLRSAVDQAKKGQNISSVQSLSAKVKDVAEQFFGKEKNWKGEKLNKVNQFMTAVQETIEQAEIDKEGKLTPNEIDTVLSDFSRKVVLHRERFGFDILAADVELNLKDIPPMEMRALNKAIDTFGEESKEDIVKLRTFLLDNNIPVTSDNLIKAYEQASR